MTTDKQLTREDLSPDQREVYEAMVSWTMRPSNRSASFSDESRILTVAGFAGCLSGETIVQYNRGSRVSMRPITLRDLYLKFNGYAGSGRGNAQRWADLTMPTHMPSLWPDGTVGRNRIVAVFESGVKPVVRLDLTGDRHLILTADHPIAIKGGTFVAAGALSKGDIVIAQGTMLAVRGGQGRRLDLRPPRVIVNVKYHPTGARKTTWCNGIAYDYARVSRARLVVEAAMNNLSYEEFVHCLKHYSGVSATFKTLPKTVDVHHDDEDTLNDDISNLKVLPKAEHARIHGKDHEKYFQKDYTRELKVVRRHRSGEEMTYDVQMEPPANNFVANGIFVHNTGKSTLLGVFAAETKLRVAYCAFTGRAASVLQRKLRAAGCTSSVTTIHRLIYLPVVDSKTEEVLGWKKRQHLDGIDLIVIDEASMVSGKMLDDLKVYGKPILAVGDHGQLPPVMDSGDLMKSPDLRLEKIHRQAESSPIIQFSKVVRETGCLDRRLADGDKIRFASRRDIEAVLAEAYFSASIVSTLNVGVLCWTNETRIRLNGYARRCLKFRGCPNFGEVVICLKNAPPLYNGMRGILATPGELQDYKVVASVGFPEEGLPPVFLEMFAGQFNRKATYKSIDELRARGVIVDSMKAAGSLFDFGYALTCHKSQGSQFNHAIVYVDRREEPNSDDWRRWAYTAVTRASERLTVLA